MKKITVLFLSALAITTTSSAAFAQQDSDFSAKQRQEIGKIAADYLREHPQILVQISQELQKQQQQQQQQQMVSAAVQSSSNLLDVKGIPHIGPKNAKVTVTEFFDYQCYYCHHMAPIVEKLMKANPKVQFVFRDWPIFASRWENSGKAATVGLQVWHDKGAASYIKYHNGIFATNHDEGKLTETDISQVAKAAVGKAFKQVNDEAYKKTIMKNDALARQIGFQGTPGFIVMPTKGASVQNTAVIGGAVPLQALQQAIDKAQK